MIDFTQVPDPASVVNPGVLNGSICAAIGLADGAGTALPLSVSAGGTVGSLIFDMGSGTEIVDGAGKDFQVIVLSGTYTVAVGNTPFASSFVAIPGTFSGTGAFDLAGTGLGSARYVQVTASPSVSVDAVQSLNVFADEVRSDVGALTHVNSCTILARRSKAPETPLDPFLELIAPDGQLFGPINDAGFGDDLSLDLSDPALVNKPLSQEGLYRFLVKGDRVPLSQASGNFFARLETSGAYDQVEIAISPAGEAQVLAQKNGAISATRQRDSYLFQAAPGSSLNFVVNVTGAAPLHTLIELYDPEDFLIGAADDSARRGSKAILTGVLPATGSAGALPNPSTYRVVVSALDGFGGGSALSGGTAYIRAAASGSYELKAFTGPLLAFTSLLLQKDALVLQWGTGVHLQAAPSANGPWKDVPGATSGTNLPVLASQQFFRLVP